jgi:hypothetical protein
MGEPAVDLLRRTTHKMQSLTEQFLVVDLMRVSGGCGAPT